MPFVPVPDVAEVEMVFIDDFGNISENTLYFTKASPTESDLATLLDNLNTAITTSLLPLLSSSIKLLKLIGTLLDVADGLSLLNTTGLPIAGGDATVALPHNASLAIKFSTSRSGRSFHGRNYVTGLVDRRTQADTLTSSYVNALVDAWVDIAAAATDNGWQQVVVSRFSGGSPRTTGVATVVNNISTTDLTIDSQRRRLNGRGA